MVKDTPNRKFQSMEDVLRAALSSTPDDEVIRRVLRLDESLLCNIPGWSNGMSIDKREVSEAITHIRQNISHYATIVNTAGERVQTDMSAAGGAAVDGSHNRVATDGGIPDGFGRQLLGAFAVVLSTTGLALNTLSGSKPAIVFSSVLFVLTVELCAYPVYEVIKS